MSKEEYKKHLSEVVMAVFAAEMSVNDVEPDLREKLRRREISAEGYCDKIAGEMISRMKEEELEEVLR